MAAERTSVDTATESGGMASVDELIDEVLVRKGPAKYVDGLSEDNWEKVRLLVAVTDYCNHRAML